MTENNVEKLLGISNGQLKSLTKDELITFMMGTMKDQQIMLNDIKEKLDKLDQLDEIQRSIAAMTTRVASAEVTLGNHDTEIDILKPLPERVERIEETANNNFADLYKTWEYMQRFMEGLDSHQRGRNVIMLGVPESGDTFGDDDVVRATNIIEKTGAMTGGAVGEVIVRRLGELRSGRDNRPLHVTLEDHGRQWKLLQNSKHLKEITGYSTVYIKKDIHPTIRYELNRLRKREREEKEKVANRGATIVYDWRARVLKRNDVVIDRFNPSFQ